ncbi:putative ankyrin repeat domain protein [Penicillium brasilianum]|uniref:Putative ankyrin repeat domain protein n=1 Tax=Penicillium brasilianum TaxID=104259 RepID=A0A1S9R9G7_PENBI|nr:putative ankyrin repeat domain protein [Penicillium brasilianum]
MFNLFGMGKDDVGRGNRPAEPISPLQSAVDDEAVDTIRELVSQAEPADLTAALCRSCQHGKIAAAQTLIESGQCNLNAAGNGDTPLFLAAKRLEPTIVRLLLQNGADVTVNSLNQSRSPAAAEKPPAYTPLHGVVDEMYRHRGEADVPRLKELMQMLLDAGCDINAQDFHGQTVLLSCLTQEVALVEFLLQQGADPNVVINNGTNTMSYLHKPLQYPEWFKALMEHGARLDVGVNSQYGTCLHVYASKSQLGDLSLFKPYVSDWNLTDANGNTLLHAAAKVHRRGSVTVSELLKLGLDVNQRNHAGQQPIHMVEGFGENLRDILDILRAAGGDLDAKDYDGRTLLTKTMYGHPHHNARELITELVKRGANINAQDHKGDTLLSYIIEQYDFRSEYVDFLLEQGADPTAVNYEGDTFLHKMAACLFGQESDTAILTMMKLLGTGTSPTLTNHKGQTPLHVLCSHVSDHLFAASNEGDKYAIDLLLDAGLCKALNVPDHQGIRPIHLAASVSEILVGRLISHGADVSVITKDGRNLLHIASMARQSNTLGMLLDHYSTNDLTSLINAKSEDGRTPLHLACISGRTESVSLLIANGADIHIEDKKKWLPLDICALSIEEDQLWQKADDHGNLFHTMSAAGILADDYERPKIPTRKNQKREDHKNFGWKGEITSESATLGVGRIVRLLAQHGALEPKDESGHRTSPLWHAVSEGNEEMAAELDKLSKTLGIELERNRSVQAERCLLRSKHIPELFKERFKSYIIDKDIMEMVLLGHDQEVAQALEENANTIENKSALQGLLILLARWGYPEIFERIGRLMQDVDPEWINKSGKVFLGGAMSPSLLAAAQRDLPNLEVVKVMVENFNADVNVQFQEGMDVIPKVYYQSTMAQRRQFKPGDTVLHYLAQGIHWWHEKAIKYLLQHGADPNARDAQGKTPLCVAVSRGELAGHRQNEIVQILLDGGADPNLAATCGYTALAMSTHNFQLFRLLIDNGAYPSEHHPMELFSALSDFNEDVVTALLGMDLDANTTTLSDAQPHWHTQRVQKIHQVKGYVLQPLQYISMMPFNEANSRHHSIRMIHLLLEHGADPFLHNKSTSILHEIFADGGIIQPWLELPDLDLERRDPRGQTLLLAASRSDIGTDAYACQVPLFPHRGGRIQPTYWVEGDPTRAMTLYERGANLTAVDHQGNNVLHNLAALKNEEKFAQDEFRRTMALFVEKAPELVDQVNNLGQTPLLIAQDFGHRWATEILEQKESTEEETG